MEPELYYPPKDPMAMMELITDRDITSWKRDKPGVTLNLGAGNKLISGAIALDLPEWDADKDEIPFKDGTISNIYAIHFLEHVKDPIAVLRECQRVLVPNGHLNVGLPYYKSQGAYHDLDHKSFWCEETWRNLFGNPYYQKNHMDWQFEVGMNLIFGLVERNLMLMTQLIKRSDETEGKRTYLLLCMKCGDSSHPLPQPFDSDEERGRWASLHTKGTGHDNWRVWTV